MSVLSEKVEKAVTEMYEVAKHRELNVGEYETVLSELRRKTFESKQPLYDAMDELPLI